MKKYIIAFLTFFSFIGMSHADDRFDVKYFNEGARYYITCINESSSIITSAPIKEIIEFKDGMVKYKQMNDAYGFSPAERCNIRGLSGQLDKDK